MIELEGVSKKFGSKTVIDNLSLSIKDGEYIVFSGESGAGKTTLLNLLGGLEKPDSGTITVNHLDILKAKNLEQYFRETVAFLFQNFALIENKTAVQNLKMIRKDARTSLTIDTVLKRVGLLASKNQKVYQLSGGEQQRLALARIMLKKASIILADEPTGSLDEKNTEVVMAILEALNAEGKTLIIVTHDDKIKKRAERIIEI